MTSAAQFDFSNDGERSVEYQLAFCQRVPRHVTSYTEDMGRVPDDFYQIHLGVVRAGHVESQRGNLTIDVGLRMYRWGSSSWGRASRRLFSFGASIRSGAASLRRPYPAHYAGGGTRR